MKTFYQVVIKDNKTDEIVYNGTTIYSTNSVFRIVEDMNYDFENNNENKTAFARKLTWIDEMPF